MEIVKLVVERLLKLLCVKSIVTIIITLIFAKLALVGIISGEQFLTVFTVIIAFYFGTQAEKRTMQGTAEK